MDLEAMQGEFPAAAFLMVYIREAHARDEWEMKDNTSRGIRVWQPETVRERRAAALTMVEDLGITIPVVLDGIDDAVSEKYGGWPERLYVLDEEGRIVYQGAVGPFGFHPGEVRDVLARRWATP